MGRDTGVDKAAVAAIDTQLRAIRAELAAFDQYKANHPPIFDLSRHELPPEDAHALRPCPRGRDLRQGGELASAAKAARVLELCRKIEERFHYPAPDGIVQKAQIPGGHVHEHALPAQGSQARGAKSAKSSPSCRKVRLDCGLPPLVTPTSQIVGVQAVNCVVDKALGKPYYTNVSKNFAELVRGSYGKTPWPIDPDFRQEDMRRHAEEKPYDVSAYASSPTPRWPSWAASPLAVDEKEELLLELFPSVAEKFLKGKRKREWDAATRPPPEPEKPARYAAEFWEGLPLQAGA